MSPNRSATPKGVGNSSLKTRNQNPPTGCRLLGGHTKSRFTCGWVLFLNKALEFASRVQNPYALAAFSMVLICALILFRKRLKPWISIALGVIFLIPATIPLVANAILALTGIYHIRIVVLAPDSQPASQATVVCSIQGLVLSEAIAIGNLIFLLR